MIIYRGSRCTRLAGSWVAPKPAPICTAPSHHRRCIAKSSTRYHSACFSGDDSQCTRFTRTSWQRVFTFLRSVLYLVSWRAHHTVPATFPDCSVGLNCCDTTDGTTTPTWPMYRAIEAGECTRTYPRQQRGESIDVWIVNWASLSCVSHYILL